MLMSSSSNPDDLIKQSQKSDEAGHRDVVRLQRASHVDLVARRPLGRRWARRGPRRRGLVPRGHLGVDVVVVGAARGLIDVLEPAVRQRALLRVHHREARLLDNSRADQLHQLLDRLLGGELVCGQLLVELIERLLVLRTHAELHLLDERRARDEHRLLAARTLTRLLLRRRRRRLALLGAARARLERLLAHRRRPPQLAVLVLLAAHKQRLGAAEEALWRRRRLGFVVVVVVVMVVRGGCRELESRLARRLVVVVDAARLLV
mmetsp:Transcript_26587/g.70945  ORF Transcript_26587/g.70945 Transcript_26587/m.70945 type:complete len:263 (-) Transcript_26587:399-1187(-)